MSDTVNLFSKEVPTCCYIDMIYDPDVDGTDVSASGKYILKEGSLVTERDSGILYYVVSVNPTTFKHTIAPSKIKILDAENDVSIVSYGNDRFMLYYDDRIKPTALVVDSKLIIIGPNIVEYRLSRVNSNNETEYVSIYLGSDGKYYGERIPMAAAVENGSIKYPTNCHTLFTLTDGENVVLEAFNTLGILAAKVTLVAMRADILNDLATDANPIIKFDMECLQTQGDDFFVYTKQDPNTLNIQPYVIYADGSRKDIPVDNSRCFIYGLTDYNPSYPGYKQPIMAKIFLTTRETSTINTDTGKHRFISTIRNLVTVANTNTIYGKLSVLPIWNNLLSKYELRWFLYINTRDRMWDVTDLVTETSETAFDGTKYTGQIQKITMTIDIASLLNIDAPVLHVQNVWLTLYPSTEYQRYIIRDGVSDNYAYGVESSTMRKPVIHYDETLTQYFIPTSIFANKEAILESFYTNARPMYDPVTETVAPTPTHFTVRDSYGRMVITNPIPIDQYTQAWSVITAGLASQYVNSTLVVEWLKEKSTNQYEIIYGVPVEVKRSSTGYNTEVNTGVGG